MLERIMLIDDSDIDAETLQFSLRRAGLDSPIFWIRDPEEAMAYLAGEREYGDRENYPIPSVLLLDLKMPKIDGLEVLKWAKAQPQLNRMLIILVTHYEDAKVINEGYRLGAHSYLNKSGTDEEFMYLVQFLRSYSFIAKPSPGEKVAAQSHNPIRRFRSEPA